MNESAVRTGRAHPAETWRLRAWPHDPTARLLVFVDLARPPTADDFGRAITQATADGARVLRTSALYPSSAEIAHQFGFTTIDTLALLRLRLDDQVDHWIEARYGAVLPITRPLRAWHHARAAAVDEAAFGRHWGNDADSLAEIRSATPVHRARLVGRGKQVAGFAVSGASADTGYIQRLAVHPDHRRQGHARNLVADALAWMRRRRLGMVYVNTGLDNDAALALYAGFGFTRLDEVLTIAERTIA
jgi:ribosomal protein S18 acetylase RimI-like enzyme